MPLGERFKRLLGKGGVQKKDSDKKNVGKGSGADKVKENEVKKDVKLDTAETRAEVNQSHQPTAQHDTQEVAEPAKDGNLVHQVIATPILNLPPGDTLNAEEDSNKSTESAHGLQKASPLGPNKERLWDESYDILCKKEPKLMKAYEKDLLSFQTQEKKGMLSSILPIRNMTCLCLSYSRAELAKEAQLGPEAQIQSLLLSKIQDVENSPLKISVGQKDIVVKEQSKVSSYFHLAMILT
jgi:hypothetical protein